MKFKAGDRVKYVSNKYEDCESNPLWGGKCGKIAGTVKHINWIEVYWDNGELNEYYPEDLKLVKRTIRDVREGDIIVDVGGDEEKVLGVHQCCVHLSTTNNFDEIGRDIPFEKLKEFGYKLKDQEEEEEVELTIDEIADKFGISVDKLKIKKED